MPVCQHSDHIERHRREATCLKVTSGDHIDMQEPSTETDTRDPKTDNREARTSRSMTKSNLLSGGQLFGDDANLFFSFRNTAINSVLW